MAKYLLIVAFFISIYQTQASNKANTLISENTAISASLTVSLNIMSASCNGVCDGLVNATASGSASPYTFSWSTLLTNTGTSSSITNLCAGMYTITLTDANGTSSVQPFTITSPQPILGNLVSTNATSANNDGSISASTSGGTSPYTYNWSAGAVTSSTINGLAAGNYCVTITDANSCTAVECATVSQSGGISSPNIMITEIMYNPPESGTDSLEFIEFYNAGSNAVNLNGFSFSQGVIHTFGNVSISGNSYYVIAVDSSAFRNIYGVAADDEWTSGGLSNSGEDIILIDNNSVPVDTVDYDDNTPWPSGFNAGQPDGGGASIVLCSLSSSNNNGTNWSTSTVSTNQVVNGQTILASPGMPNTCAAPILISITTTDESCIPGNDGTATASVTGGNSPYTYLWSNGATSSSIQNLISGSYNVTVTDALSNTATSSASVGSAPPFTLSLVATNTSSPTSNDGTITTSITGGSAPFSFLWNDGNTLQNRTNLSAGSYNVTVTDNQGCSQTASALILNPNAIQLNVTTNDALCHGDSTGSISLTASGGTSPYTYSWSTGDNTSSISGLSSGSYTVTVMDANQTDTVLSFFINQPNLLLVNTTSSPTSCVGCLDGSILATASGGTPAYTYAWSSGVIGNPATNLSAGVYCVTVSDMNGCTVSSCDTVKEPGAIANLVITEIMYNPPESGTDSLEYIEFVNAGNTTVSLNGYSFGEGVAHSFGNEIILPGEFYVIAVDSSAFRNIFGKAANNQWNSGGLSNGGEDITIIDNFGRTVDSVDYDNSSPWPTASSGGPSGGGASIELIDSLLDNNLGTNWQVSTTLVGGVTVNGSSIYGSPGNSNLVVNIEEILAKSDFSIYPNPTQSVVNIVGLRTSKRVQVFDQIGKLQLDKQMNTSENSLNLKLLDSGIYFLRIQGIDKTIKLIKY